MKMKSSLMSLLTLCYYGVVFFCNLFETVQAFQHQQDTSTTRSFTIDYENNCFLKDGKPFRYVSGSMHYFRVPPAYWRDRMIKMKAAGLNVLQTYIEWSRHEPKPGKFDFEGDNDIVSYIKTADEVGLLVILRPGPYIDAEREMGGFPWWLLSENKNMKLRSRDPTYLKYVDRYFKTLLPLIKPLLYHNGGPIISIQVENEYGSYSACDFQYTTHLRDLYRQELGEEILLFTTDGSGDHYLMCGKIDGVYATVDFGSGSNITDAFFRQRLHQSRGPLVNSEFYPGWLDYWGQKHANVGKQQVAKALDKILATNASVNIYMFHGGTSFGFTNGGNIDGGVYKSCPTSYDYDAPLSEAGDPTPKYFSLRDVIGKYMPLPSIPPPQPSPKMEVGPIKLSLVSDLFTHMNRIQMAPVQSKYPLTFEDLKQGYGFVLYSTYIPFQPSDPAILEIKGLQDRGYVYVNKIFQGILIRSQITKMPLIVNKNDTLSILVENQGRICYGNGIKDFKGILSNVTLGKKVLVNWTHEVFPVWDNISQDIQNMAVTEKQMDVPAFYIGTFALSNDSTLPLDTFLRLDGWHKGVAFLNGYNLGRYWPIQGPQETLYAPAPFFKPYPQKNVLLLLELEHAPCTGKNRRSTRACTVKFVKQHVINGPVPYQ